MKAIGLMDNFQNSSGFAALAMEEPGHLGVEVFGGIIMQPTAGGVTFDAAQSAIGYGYGPGTGTRFVSLPTHHTTHVAKDVVFDCGHDSGPKPSGLPRRRSAAASPACVPTAVATTST
jgi:hypothetical protein